MVNKEYAILEKKYKNLKAEYTNLKENGEDKKEIKKLGTKLYKLALSQVTILQKVELNES